MLLLIYKFYLMGYFIIFAYYILCSSYMNNTNLIFNLIRPRNYIK